jgi:chromate transporter
MNNSALVTLATNFALMSLFAIGGGNSAIPEMHRLAVEVEGWMTDRQFTDVFALAQVTPGPNMIIVTLIGYQVAGALGALVATAAMCGPSCVLAFYIGGVWERFKDARWRVVVQAGLLPISIGLLGASGFVVASAAVNSLAVGVLVAAVAVVSFFTRVNPAWIFVAAALIGLAGLL